ncbi:MAG TPA: DUF4037 domain-containing protein [Pseudonocardiaceae bacterium]|nr:DUF4037 domain-containing protein [Pseudonocardiaceae bacterium]
MEFLPGLRLAATFYDGAVRPLLDEYFPGLPHAAALIGYGSEVLGFDTARSTDHNWGPRLQVFLPDASRRAAIESVLADRLPATWRGYPTAFTFTQEADQVARQRVEVACLADWLNGWLGFDPTDGVTVTDWLAMPTQRLAEVTQGAVYHDGAGDLTAVRAALAWYPDDLWRYVLACQWQRISQEWAFPGRCAEVGDNLGSLVVAARLVRDIMRLCLLMRRVYPPYSKWLGTAFARLPGLGDLPAHLTGALSAPDWPAREDHLVAAYRAVAVLHNELALTEPVATDIQPFFDRPIRIIGGARFRGALLATVDDPAIKKLPLTGTVDQFVDSVEALGDNEFTRAITTQPT